MLENTEAQFSLYRVSGGDSDDYYTVSLLKAYRVAQGRSIWEEGIISLQKVCTKNLPLSKVLILVMVDKEPFWHFTTDLRYFKAGEARK